jgi:hypothetical protein
MLRCPSPLWRLARDTMQGKKRKPAKDRSPAGGAGSPDLASQCIRGEA